LPPFAYAEMQILAEAVEATHGIDQAKIADYIHGHAFDTIVGSVSFGKDGEWVKPRPIWLQYQHVQDNALEQFKSTKTAVILSPPELKTGDLIYPYTDAKR
jgi:branched-chain amino acid transport system substrate-binding protein